MQYIAMEEYGTCHGNTLADTLDECVEKAVDFYGCKSEPETKESLLSKGLSFCEIKPIEGWRVT